MIIRPRIYHILVHAALVATLAPSGGVLLAQSVPAQAIIDDAQAPLPGSIALPSRPDLPRLLDLASQRLHIPVEYDPSLFNVAVALRLPEAVPDDQLWALINRLLAARGLTTVQLTGSDVYSVVKTVDAAALARVQTGAAPVPTPGFQTVLLVPEHRSVKEAADLIRPLLSKPGGVVTELGGGGAGMLLVSDLTARIEQAREVLGLVDVAGAAGAMAEVGVFEAPAEAVISLALQIAQGREASSGQKAGGELIASPTGDAVFIVGTDEQVRYWRGLIRALDRPEVVETRAYAVAGATAGEAAGILERMVPSAVLASPGEPSEEWRVEVDEAAGLVTVTTVPSRHRRVEEILATLGSGDRGPLPMRAFPVRNRPVTDMVATLSKLMDAGALGDGAGEARREVAQAAEQRTVREPSWRAGALHAGSRDGGQRSLGAETERAAGLPLRLTADEATNTLIAVGEPRLLAQLEALIPQLDVRQPQVMLEVTLVSLSDTEAMNLGVELERIGSLGDATTRLSSLFGLSSGGGGGARTVGDAAGFTGAVLNPGEFSAIIRALEAINKGRSMSMPKVLVTNNEQATFSSVVQQPILETVRSDGGTTTSFAGTEDAGTTISVRPQIAQGDHLVLTYQLSLSSFVGPSAAPGLPPPKQQNKVDSVATIPDGHTVVVGGLEFTSDSKGTTQVPWIGRIPLVGELFKSRAVSSSRARFFVFIRPTVLRNNNFEDLKYISSTDATAARVDDGFPVVKARVIR